MSGTVERHPGPTVGDNITFSCLNIHCAVLRAALVHTTIADHHLDLRMLQETWINHDDSAATQKDLARTATTSFTIIDR